MSKSIRNGLMFATLFSLQVFAQTASAQPQSEGENPYKRRPHVVGIQASSIGGLGATYKYAFGDLVHARLTGMAFPSKSQYSTETFYNIGTDVHFNIFQVVTGPNTYMRSYIAPAISYWGYSYSDSRFNTQYIHAGVNLGFELVLASRFSVHGELGMGYYEYGYNYGYTTGISGGLGIGLLF